MEIKPHKFPPVKFERNYDDKNPDISYVLMEIYSLRKAINNIRVLPNWAEAIQKKIVAQLMIESIHGTLAIEGNPSTEKEVEESLAKTQDLKKVKGRQEQERINMVKACEYIKEIGKKPKNKARILITEEIVKKLHETITFNTYENNNIPGQYRNSSVEVGHERYGGTYKPPSILADIKMLMEGFTTWINSEEAIAILPIFRAIMGHYYLAIIHPFADGNGRTARAIECLILQNYGFKYGASFALWRGYYEKYGEYFTLLQKTRRDFKGDQTEFILFVLTLLQKSLDNINSGIRSMIDALLFKDYVSYLNKRDALTSRQFAIVNFLLDHEKWLSIKELFDNPIIQELYKKKKAKIRLFQKDINNIVKKLSLFNEVEKEGEKVLVCNYDDLLESE